MFQSLKTKPARIALVAAGVVIGGIGTATAVSAQTADDGPTNEPTNEPTDATVEGNKEQKGRDGDKGRHGRKGCGRSLDTVAEIIGIEADELKAALDEGQSLADVAEANGVHPDAVVDALIADAEARIEEKVEAGRLTEAEAAEKLAEKTDHIEDRVA
ncbi:MAG: hypothetical protein GY773_26955, partial [Actinomycetia bacterium]|nr:hypothetical protein [Actinomycetes bacterium]